MVNTPRNPSLVREKGLDLGSRSPSNVKLLKRDFEMVTKENMKQLIEDEQKKIQQTYTSRRVTKEPGKNSWKTLLKIKEALLPFNTILIVKHSV